MKTIEIVTHAYAEELPHYASALVYQISSLVLDDPGYQITLSVCLVQEDERVAKVASWASRVLEQAGIEWKMFCLSRREIGRRCIGRNRAAIMTEADIVWFADVDQAFRDGVLDRLAELEWPEGASMIYPRTIKIHKDHVTGDALLHSLDRPRLVDVSPDDFVDKRYRKAIGGVQIVRGDFAREHGYLNGDEKWQKPTESPFGDFRDDVAYRRVCERHGPIVGVDLQGLHRLRHVRTTYQSPSTTP